MIIASNNKNKISQIKNILKNVSVMGQSEAGITIDIEENGKTFRENANIKAKAIYNITHQEVLADDSGLCINFLKGWPGVKTHRFLGENTTNEERNAYILKRMEQVKYKKRGASAICVIAYCNSKGKIKTFTGVFKTKLLFLPCGNNKFGFDEIIEVSHGVSVAQITETEKEKINMRSIALRKFIKYYEKKNKSVNKSV